MSFWIRFHLSKDIKTYKKFSNHKPNCRSTFLQVYIWLKCWKSSWCFNSIICYWLCELIFQRKIQTELSRQRKIFAKQHFFIILFFNQTCLFCYFYLMYNNAIFWKVIELIIIFYALKSWERERLCVTK